MVRSAVILGTGMTAIGKLNKSAITLMQEAVEAALSSAKLELRQIDGLVAVPSLSNPHFMQAHHLATTMSLLPNFGVQVKTMDTGGAGPITALLEAVQMIQYDGCKAVVVAAGDAVSSLPTSDFLARADKGCSDPSGDLKSPVIPHGYDRIAKWQMETHGVTREQLAMVSVLMSRQASRHPQALTKEPHTLNQVLNAQSVAPCTSILECARRADGAAAIVVTSDELAMEMHELKKGPNNNKSRYIHGGVVILGGGEASGPLYPPTIIDETMFSCEIAARTAFIEAQVSPKDIDFWGLYDCFPICFIRALEAVGVCKKGEGGMWVEEMYHKTKDPNYDPSDFPINTHGGLLGFGAPWETPALFNVIEACEQLQRRAHGRQIKEPRRALVYGNGGIFSHSSVAILSSPVEH
mmetsp:Transcript_24429/g.36250  ORF Transcript_24429/g.36250 Transcript_24429/m.36250 type:complete len:409 (-) Transcript_24429:186-1412(-)